MVKPPKSEAIVHVGTICQGLGTVERPEDYRWSSSGEAMSPKSSKVRELFGGKRKTGARVMREVGWKEKKSRLYTLRQLRKNVLG